MKDYVLNHPEDGEKITRLRDLMFEQVEWRKGQADGLLPILAEIDMYSDKR